jgi:hypothetical protein
MPGTSPLEACNNSTNQEPIQAVLHKAGPRTVVVSSEL